MNQRSTIREYLQVLRRRRWIAFQAIVLVPAAAVTLSMLEAPRYDASAEVLLSRQNLASSLNNVVDPTFTVDAQRLVDTQTSVARAPQIAVAVLQQAKLTDRTPGQLLAASSVSGKTGADVLVFHVSDRHPNVAAHLATLYAQQYLVYANELGTRALRAARQEVEAKIADLEGLGRRTGSLYADLIGKDQQLATMEALQTGNATLLKPADGASQVQPQPIRDGLLGLLVGLVLGIGLAFLRDHLDTKVRHANEVSQRLGLPLLARLPEPPRDLRRRRRPVMLEQPTSQFAEPFRVLLTNLDFVSHESRPKTIMVSSAREGEGKSTTAANLAIAIARSGKRVALVDLDLRCPVLHEFFQTPAQPGLTNVAIGRARLEDALIPIPLTQANGSNGKHSERQFVVQGDLALLCCGAIPPNPGEFVRSQGVARVLALLGQSFDMVVVDAAPLLGIGDSLALIPRVDALIVVARLELLARPLVDELARVLEGSPAKPLGIVVTASQRERESGYGSYGYVPYGYGHETAQRTNGHVPVAGSIEETAVL